MKDLRSAVFATFAAQAACSEHTPPDDADQHTMEVVAPQVTKPTIVVPQERVVLEKPITEVGATVQVKDRVEEKSLAASTSDEFGLTAQEWDQLRAVIAAQNARDSYARQVTQPRRTPRSGRTECRPGTTKTCRRFASGRGGSCYIQGLQTCGISGTWELGCEGKCTYSRSWTEGSKRCSAEVMMRGTSLVTVVREDQSSASCW